MSRRWKLVPVVMMAALVASCGDSADDTPVAGNVAAPAPIAAAPPAPPPVATPAPRIPPVQPPTPPVVTVRAQPAPYFPLDLPPSDVAASATPFPKEVTTFMVARDGCDHFRGEEAYDAERRAFIAENVAELCHGSDANLATLRRRYADDPSVIAALKSYDDRIEPDHRP